MTKRREQIYSTMSQVVETQTNASLHKVIELFLSSKKQETALFQERLLSGFEKAASFHSQKGDIKHICISYLLSSLQLGRCEFRIDYYNHDFYLDTVPCEVYWEAEFLSDCLQGDAAWIEDELRKTMIRVKNHEIREAHLSYLSLYYTFLPFFISDLMNDIDLKAYKDILDEDVSIYYGGFMDKGIQVATIKKGVIDVCATS